MDFWTNLVVMLDVAVAIAIIGLVLLQHGKGADMGSGFGSGTSGSLFGASGSANFLSRMTAALAAVFFVTSLGLGYIATQKPKSASGGSVVDAVKADAKKAPAPAKADEKAKPAAEVPAVPSGDAPKAADAPKAKDVPN